MKHQPQRNNTKDSHNTGKLHALSELPLPNTKKNTKEILKSKYGGARRLLRAYMDQLEQMPLIRINDILALERFADLVRITVVKLQAEGRDGELTDGPLHSLLVKKLPDRQLENYSLWLNELACVAGGIVSAREIKFWTSERRSREENGDRDSEIPPARKLEFFE